VVPAERLLSSLQDNTPVHKCWDVEMLRVQLVSLIRLVCS